MSGAAGRRAGQARGAGWRRLLRPRWLWGHLLAAALIGLFVGLGLWQLQRLESLRAANELLEARLAAPAASLAELRAEYGAAPEALRLRRAAVVGTYAPELELLLRSRSREGRPGWHVLTPLVLQDGRALLVDRGWVPYEMDSPPVAQAAPPPGRVEVRGVLQAEQDPPAGGLAAAVAPSDPREGVLEAAYYVDVERLQAQLPFELEPVYLELTDQRPGQPGELPLELPEPQTREGPHLSYALQWFTFALIGAVGYMALLRRTLRDPEA